MKAFFSTTVTWKPALASRAAIATPPTPAPDSVTVSEYSTVIPEVLAYDYRRLLAQLLPHTRKHNVVGRLSHVYDGKRVSISPADEGTWRTYLISESAHSATGLGNDKPRTLQTWKKWNTKPKF